MSAAAGTGDLLAAAQAAGTARPLVTYYDDATGERVELSAATFGNWVAKTVALLDDVGVARGDRVALLLPAHWQSTVFLVSCWTLGAVAAVSGSPGGCAAAVASADGLPPALDLGAGTTLGLSLDAFGRPLDDPPDGVVDYAAEVRAYPDELLVADRPEPGDEALSEGDRSYTGSELVALAAECAGQWGLADGGRLLTDAGPDGLDGVLASAIAPLARGGSVVLCRNLDRTAVDRRVATERVTCVLVRGRRG